MQTLWGKAGTELRDRRDQDHQQRRSALFSAGGGGQKTFFILQVAFLLHAGPEFESIVDPISPARSTFPLLGTNQILSIWHAGKHQSQAMMITC